MSSDRPGRQTTVLETDVGLARKADLAKLQRRVRTLVRELMREVLTAVAMASPAEIGELMRARPERRSFALGSAPAVAPLVSAVRSSGNGSRTPSVQSETAPPRSTRLRARRHLADHAPPVHASRKDTAAVIMQQDPFAITSPGELLASGGPERERREHEAETAERRPPRQPVALAAETPAAPEPVLPSLLETPAPSPSSDKVVESERRPRIVLREGERLLSATGSGVVIRRERRVLPHR